MKGYTSINRRRKKPAKAKEKSREPPDREELDVTLQAGKRDKEKFNPKGKEAWVSQKKKGIIGACIKGSASRGTRRGK